MDADFSIELGREDPVLDFPWTDPDGRFTYFDLKRQPELLARLEEASRFPELAHFLRAVNSAISTVESAKCDAWATDELNREEEFFGATQKFASYVDLLFSRNDQRESFPSHERFAKQLVELLRQTPETPSAAEVCVRRGYYAEKGNTRDGFYFTVYVSGYGDDEARARQKLGDRAQAGSACCPAVVGDGRYVITSSSLRGRLWLEDPRTQRAAQSHPVNTRTQ